MREIRVFFVLVSLLGVLTSSPSFSFFSSSFSSCFFYRLLELAVDVVQRLGDRRECLYVHCWGGHGRTGTAVGVALGILFPSLSPQECLNRVQFYHDLRT